MTEKLVLRRQRSSSPNGVKPIFVDTQALNLVREVKEETGIPLGRLTEMFIEFAVKHIEIASDDESLDMLSDLNF